MHISILWADCRGEVGSSAAKVDRLLGWHHALEFLTPNSASRLNVRILSLSSGQDWGFTLSPACEFVNAVGAGATDKGWMAGQVIHASYLAASRLLRCKTWLRNHRRAAQLSNLNPLHHRSNRLRSHRNQIKKWASPDSALSDIGIKNPGPFPAAKSRFCSSAI